MTTLAERSPQLRIKNRAKGRERLRDRHTRGTVPTTKGRSLASSMAFGGVTWGSIGKAAQQLGRYQRQASPALGGSYLRAVGGLTQTPLMTDLYTAMSADLGDSTARMLGSAASDLSARRFALATQVAARQSQAARPGSTMALYKAAEALRMAALAPDPVSGARAAALLRRASKTVARSRPRHAAVALATWDALSNTKDPFGTTGRRKVLLSIAQDLLSQFVSVEREMEILDAMDDAGLERFPPFEGTVAGALSSA